MVVLSASDAYNLAASRWQKLCNFIRQSNFYRVLSRDQKVIVVELRPHICWQREVVSQDRFGTPVVNSQGFCQSLKASGRCSLRGNARAMNYEGCACASLAFLCTEICDNRD